MIHSTFLSCATRYEGNFIPITRSIGLPFASLRSIRRQANAPRIISAGGYHLKGRAIMSAVYPATISARLSPSTCASAPPEVKGTCVVQIRMLRIIEGLNVPSEFLYCKQPQITRGRHVFHRPLVAVAMSGSNESQVGIYPPQLHTALPKPKSPLSASRSERVRKRRHRHHLGESRDREDARASRGYV